MKTSLRILSVAAAVTAFTSGAFAQANATATATATATIITPISIAQVANMNFGNVAVSATLPGTVILTPAGVRSVTGSVTLPTTAGTVTAASFTVTGLADYTYTVTLPADGVVTLSDGTNSMAAVTFTSTPATTAGVLTLGTQTLNVGATLNVAAAQPAGLYVSPAFNVTVNYN